MRLLTSSARSVVEPLQGTNTRAADLYAWQQLGARQPQRSDQAVLYRSAAASPPSRSQRIDDGRLGRTDRQGPVRPRASRRRGELVAASDQPGTALRYESEMNRTIPAELAVLCLYDLNRFSAGVLVDVVQTHPRALINEMIIEYPSGWQPPAAAGAPGSGSGCGGPSFCLITYRARRGRRRCRRRCAR
jgi:hypothetical protein